MSDLAIAPPRALVTAEYILDALAAINRALEETEDISQAVNLREKAETVRFMTRKADLAREIQNVAARTRIDAERHIGRLLQDLPKNGGGRPAENPTHDVRGFEPPTYAEYGIDYGQAHRWQTVAQLPDDAYDEFVKDIVESDRDLTGAAVYRYSRNWLHKYADGEKPEKTLATWFNDAGVGKDIIALAMQTVQQQGQWAEKRLRIKVMEVE